MEETSTARASREACSADPTTEASPADPLGHPVRAATTADASSRVPLQPHELDGALDGLEITRLPWGYAVTRTTSTS